MHNGAPMWEPFNPYRAGPGRDGAAAARPARAPVYAPARKRPLTRLAYAMLWLLAFSIPWENLIILPGIGTVGKVIGAVAFAAGLLAVMDSGKLRVFSGFHLLMAAFAVWAGLTYFWTISPARTVIAAMTYAQLVGMAWLIWQFAPEQDEQTGLMSAYVLGTLVSSVDTVMAYFDKSPMLHYERYVANGFDPNDLGLILALSVPLSIYLSITRPRGMKVWIYRLHPVLTVTAILMTASRGALIALTVASLMVPLTLSRWSFKIKAVYAVVAACGVIAGAALVPESSFQRLASTGQELREGSLNERRIIWQAGLESFRMHPVEGVGAGGFSPSVAKVVSNPAVGESVAHNTFLSVLVEEGILGLALFLAFILALLFAAIDLPRLERSLWLVTGATWIVGVSALTWELRKPGWFLFGLLAAQLGARTLATVRAPVRPMPAQARMRAASARSAF